MLDRPHARRSLWLVTSALIGLVAVVAVLAWRDAFSQSASVPDNRPIMAPQENYVTSDSCRSCHPGNYASWHTSFHRTMTQVATPATLIPDAHDVELSFAGLEYKLTRTADKIFVVNRSLGEKEYGPPREIVLLTGSHTLQILWNETGQGRTLEQFPFAYIIAEKMWAPVTQTFLMPPDTKEAYSIGAWNGACMDCHVTQGVSNFVEGNKWDTKVTEFGIACEACHSEGAEHIAANRSPFRRWKLHLTKETDPTIANAKKMKGPESALACGQCHSVWAFDGMNEKIDFNRHGGKFRPGKDDLVQRFVVQPNEPDHATQKDFIRQTEPDFFRNRFWGDGMIRVTGSGNERGPGFALLQRRRVFLHLVPRDAPGHANHPRRAQDLGIERPARSEDGVRPGLPAMSQGDGNSPNEPYASRGGVGGEQLLQLPHAAHHLRSSARHAESPDQLA